jgi:hypothetical protein
MSRNLQVYQDVVRKSLGGHEVLPFPAGPYFPAALPGIDLGKFGPHKDYLGGVINPEKHHHQ